MSHLKLHFALHTSHCTLHTQNFTLHTPRFTLHTALFALHTSLHTALLRLHTSHCTLHTSHFSLLSSHFTLLTAFFTLHTSHFTLHTSDFTLHTALLGHWSLVTLITVSTFWSKKDRVTSDQVCSKSHTCHTKMVRPLCGRLWPYSCPKHDFWRKSRRKASFLSFVASFLKEVSQKSFVFEFRSFIFEGSLAEKLRCRASKHHFWRKSRRKASF